MARLSERLAKSSTVLAIVLIASLLTVAGLFDVHRAHAAALDPRALTISNSVAGATGVTYFLEVAVATPGTLGSIKIQFCSNTSLINDICDAPPGFDAGGVAVANQTGQTGFSVGAGSTANEIVLTRPPALASIGPVSYELTPITNATAVGTTFVRVMTYPTDDATGPETDSGGLALATNLDVTVSADVPQFLAFCAGTNITGFNCATAEGDFIDFGELAPDSTAAGATQLLTATNAESGYSIRVGGTTLTSGNNTIEAMLGGSPNQGTNQFGINLRANTNPNVGNDVQGPGVGQPTAGYSTPNTYRFVSGEVLATSPAPDDYRKYTVSYLVNVSDDQPGGIYTTTMTYICLANF